MKNESYGNTDHINVIVTNICNRNCPFCSAKKNTNKGNDNFITLENVKKAIEFAKKEKIKSVSLTGGEPTLNPNIIDIAEMFHNAGLEVSVYTNYDFPNIVKQLDGLVDYISVSYYGQKMPSQSEFNKTKIVISTLLLKNYFADIDSLNSFIEKYRNDATLLFTVPVNVNDYCEENTCDFLDEISAKNFLPMILPDGTILELYNGCLVKRTDLPKAYVHINTFSYKMRLDGQISHFYSDGTAKIAEIADVKLRNDLLSTHNPKIRQKILSDYRSKAV